MTELTLSFSTSLDDGHFEDIVSVGSTWFFQIIFGIFNLSMFIAISLKYWLYLTFLAIDNSYYTVICALVIFHLIIE